ncbi:histidinol dehydrogenase [Kineococcus rhizosphaerae]|uniref:Histidinol dehydrogenase n=1 Tax=Kineococcus rhizosphaerae TaxID=559628 RepID=A0A2T0QXU3_9ACTN|nr:histidinol dehydrogenase [Kineococcus rhizosphaerae]PRY10851.1 sulfopropanediol 3-dehydrogenase [Kineococcus rhizosphaerae]
MVLHLKSAPTKSFADTTQHDVAARVGAIVDDVRRDGDAAVRRYAEQFDGWTGPTRLDDDRVEEIVATLDPQVLEDIRFVQDQVRTFAQAQRDSLVDLEVETLPGVRLGQKHVPVQAAGAYVPGGKYPLTASAHMTIVTAKVAGVPRVVACTPPIRGEVPAATIAAMKFAGADEIHVLGGVQAIAAMALGTDTIAPVNLIAGPGNAYVAEAKRQLFGEVGIDLFAGPTEILIVADESADPFLVAVDLLSQAEHGPESPAVLITTSRALGEQVLAHVERLLPGMPTADYAGPAWRDWGQVLVADDLDEAYALADAFAFEHVQVFTADPREALEKMHDYGALFLGEGTCVSYGDKVIGTNHVLPTLGAARYTGGLWVGKYLRTVTYQEITDPASSARLGEVCGRAARVELFEGHARSGDVRAWKHAGRRADWIEQALAVTP